jgi:hypothetical protein
LLKLQIDNDKEHPTTIVDITSSISSSEPCATSIKRSRKKNLRNNYAVRTIHTAMEAGGMVDLTIDPVERKKRRKDYSSRPDNLRKSDPVNVVDLHFVCDYNKLFLSCIDPDTTLNTKGPLANLWFAFKLIDEGNQEEIRRVFYYIYLFICLYLYYFSFLDQGPFFNNYYYC